MKKILCSMMVMATAALMLCGCGKSKDTDAVDKLKEKVAAKQEQMSDQAEDAPAKDLQDAKEAFEQYVGEKLTLIDDFYFPFETVYEGDGTYKPEFPPEMFAVFDYRIEDFDKDGEEELMTVTLNDQEGDQNLVITFYEYDGEVKPVADYPYGESIFSSDRGETVIFRYEFEGSPVIGIITVEDYYTRADGMYMSFASIRYNGDQIEEVAAGENAGSDMEDNGFTAKMAECGIPAKWNDLFEEDWAWCVMESAKGTYFASVFVMTDDVEYDDNYIAKRVMSHVEVEGSAYVMEDQGAYENRSVVCFDIGEGMTAEAEINLSADAEAELLKFSYAADENNWIKDLTVQIGNKKCVIKDGIDGYAGDGLQCAWFQMTGGSHYLYVQWDLDNGYTGTSVYEYADGDFSYLGETGSIFFYMPGSDNPNDDWEYVEPYMSNDFYVEGTEQKLGTQFTYRRCCVGPDGMPLAIEDFSYYMSGASFVIEALEDIPAMLVDENGDPVANTEIAKGLYISPYRTDDETFIDVFVSEKEGAADPGYDAQIYRISIEEDQNSGAYVISGEYGFKSNKLIDLFGGLNFAG